MDKDRIAGAAKQAKGAIKQAAGKALGDAKLTADGKSDKVEGDGTDVDPTIQAGAPWVSLNQDGTRYFDYHHTPDDTLDKIDPAQLRQNVAAWTTVLAILSGGIEPEPKRRSRR